MCAGEWYNYLIYNHTQPPPGTVWDDINTGVFVIRPDRSTLAIYTSTQYLHSIYTISTQYLHSIYTVSTQYLHSI